MLKPWFVCLLFLIVAALTTVASALQNPSPPELPAKAYILQDFHSGNVLVEKNADARIEPASITKVMTAYLVFAALKQGDINLQDKVRISETAWRNPAIPDWMQGSRMFVEVNTLVSVEDLLRGMVVQSGNDATVALAEHVAGSEAVFVELMNKQAQELGMINTRFQNTTGWPHPEHYTSARDIATLSRSMIQRFPELYRLYSEKQFTYNNITQRNRNMLLWQDESVDGIKTGHTEAAGYCLASSAKRNDARLIAVVMSAASQKARAQQSQTLLDYGFRFYETHRLFTAGETLQNVPVWKGAAETLSVGVKEDVYVTIPRGSYQQLAPSIEITSDMIAPIAVDNTVGKLTVMLEDKIITQVPLIALSEVAEAGFIKRWIDQIKLWMQ